MYIYMSKIRTVLLGEKHYDNMCVKDNLQKIKN